MQVAGELAPTHASNDPRAGCVYVVKIGAAADLYKVGKAKDYDERLKAH
jgi:hypothetical protein